MKCGLVFIVFICLTAGYMESDGAKMKSKEKFAALYPGEDLLKICASLSGKPELYDVVRVKKRAVKNFKYCVLSCMGYKYDARKQKFSDINSIIYGIVSKECTCAKGASGSIASEDHQHCIFKVIPKPTEPPAVTTTAEPTTTAAVVTESDGDDEYDEPDQTESDDFENGPDKLRSGNFRSGFRRGSPVSQGEEDQVAETTDESDGDVENDDQTESDDLESDPEDIDLSYFRVAAPKSQHNRIMDLGPLDPNFEAKTNINAAMNGYNILTGNPNDAGNDPGIRNRIFDCMITNENGMKELHSGVTTYDIAKDEEKESISHLTTTSSYFKQLETSQTKGKGITSGLDVNVAATVPVEGVEVSGSTTIPKFMDNKYGSSTSSLDIEKSFMERHVSVHHSMQKYLEYSVEITPTNPPPFSDGFIKAVRLLHDAISGSEAEQKRQTDLLLNTYGTHFMIDTIMGRKAVLVQEYSSSMAQRYTKKQRDECASKSFQFHFGGFIGINEQSEDCKLSDETSDDSSSSDFMETITYSAGKETVPVVIQVTFSPILNLFSEYYMKDLKTENGAPINYTAILTTFLSKRYVDACMTYINDEKKCKNGMKGCGWDDDCNRETESCRNTYDENSEVVGFACHVCNEDLIGDKETGYRGCQAVTRSGKTCQAWNAQSPHQHDNTPEKYPDSGLEGNFCRNPDGADHIWCFTTEDGSRWEFCNPVGKGCSEDYWGDGGSGYRGCQTKTRTGKTCQAWSSQSPHNHDKTPENYPDSGLNFNYCRNPDGQASVWCFTENHGTEWEFCDPIGKIECIEELVGNGASYRGCQAITKTGKTCQKWEEQTPHQHDLTSLNHPNSDLESNYCRNPDGEDTIWCYTTEGGYRWEYCYPVGKEEYKDITIIREFKEPDMNGGTCTDTCDLGGVRKNSLFKGCDIVQNCSFKSKGPIRGFVRCDNCNCQCIQKWGKRTNRA